MNSYEYLQIELGQFFFLHAIETQGRFGNGQGKEYAEYYQLQYQRDNHSAPWLTYIDRQTNKTVRRTRRSRTSTNETIDLGPHRKHQHVLGGETNVVPADPRPTRPDHSLQLALAHRLHARRALRVSLLR